MDAGRFTRLFEAQIIDAPKLEKLLVSDLVNDGKQSLFSVKQLEDSLQQAITQWGEDNSKVEPLYAQLGQAYAQRIIEGKFDNREQEATRAEQLLQKAIILQSQQTKSLATTLNELAYFYYKQGKYSEAEPLYLRALAIREQQLGAEHPHVAASLNNLAGLYQSQGKYSEAEPLYLRALAIWEQQLGAEHPHVATILNNLAELYWSQGKYSEAESMTQRALTIYQTALGEQHPNTLNSLLTVKGLHIQNLLQCDKQTLINILQALA